MTIKTLNYDARFIYPKNAAIFIDEHDQFTTNRDSSNRIPFGSVVKPPSRTRKYLEIRVYTELFQVEIYPPWCERNQ